MLSCVHRADARPPHAPKLGETSGRDRDFSSQSKSPRPRFAQPGAHHFPPAGGTPLPRTTSPGFAQPGAHHSLGLAIVGGIVGGTPLPERPPLRPFGLAAKKDESRVKRGYASAACFFVLRAKGPAVCIAQPIGLGGGQPHFARANGPAICGSTSIPIRCASIQFAACFPSRRQQRGRGKLPGRWPFDVVMRCVPSPADWAMQMDGALPLKPNPTRRPADWAMQIAGSARP